MTETKPIEFFATAATTLSQKQNELRDQVLEAILAGNYSEADSKLKELQTVSVGINLCQQTVLREQERLSAQAKAELELGKIEAARAKRLAKGLKHD